MNVKRVTVLGALVLILGGGLYGGYHYYQKTSQAKQQAASTQKQVDKATKESSSVTTSKKTSSSRSQAVQKILDQYHNQKNIGVAYTDLSTGTTASTNGDTMFYAASVAKLPIIAYVQREIATGKISWDTKFAYADAANSSPSAMVSGGTGTLQNENHQGQSYSVEDLTKRAVEQSDNQASNQLYYHVANANSQGFSAYLESTVGAKTYSKTMSSKQANQAIISIWKQDQKASQWLEQTNWAHDKIGSLPVTVAHKIGINGAANNDAAIVLSNHKFALTIMTDGWSDEQVDQLAQKIYAVAK